MPNSQTRKRSSARMPTSLNDLHWLANPYEQLKRSVSFSGKGVSNEEFYRFFEEVGEVAANRSSTRKSPKGVKSPKGARSPKGVASPKGAKSPRSKGKSPKPNKP